MKAVIMLDSVFDRFPTLLKGLRPYGTRSSGLDDGVEIELEGFSCIVIGKVRLAASLSWQPSSSEEKLTVQASRLSTEDRVVDLVIDLPSSGQHGFGSTSDGISPGLPAAVSCISPAVTATNFLAAFRLGTREAAAPFWVVSFRDGAVFEDRIVREEDDARRLFEDAQLAPDWADQICPDDWGLVGTREAGLHAFLEFPAKPQKLKAVRPIKQNLGKIVLGALVLGLVVGGSYGWSAYKENQEAIEREMAALRKTAARVDPFSHPWVYALPVERFVGDCLEKTDQVFRSIPGWRPEPIKCEWDGKNLLVTTSWSRESGRIAMLRAGFPEELADQIKLAEGGGRADLSVSTEIEVTPDIKELPLAPDLFVPALTERFQTLGLELSLRANVARLTIAQEKALKAPVYNNHAFRIETDVAPRDYASLIADIPALRADLMIFDPLQNRWEITGRIFHPPLMPKAGQ